MAYANNIICLWSGAVADIPDGWELCDGVDGRPDLRNRFIVEAGDTYAVNASGGGASHNHSATTDGHFHWHVTPADHHVAANTGNGHSTESDTLTTGSETPLPKYYALCYVIKT